MTRPSLPVRIVDETGQLSALTEDGEIWTTVTERENDVWSQYANIFNFVFYHTHE